MVASRPVLPGKMVKLLSCFKIYSLNFFLNWRIIHLQYCGFCHTSTWIIHRYTYTPSLLNPTPISYPILPLYVITENWVELPVSHRKFPHGIYFIYGNDAKECSNYRPIALISHASEVMLQARLQQYMNCELPDVQAGFRKSRGTRDQTTNIRWIIEKARVPEKHLFLLYWLCQSPWLCGSQ